jgi:dephospho-CoA kinase
MLIVGLTGGIATGKSTVSALFEDAGIPVICLDKLSRAVVEPGTAGLAEIVHEFGNDVLGSDGRLDREALARIVFRSEEKRKKLEGIIHPKVAEEKQRLIDEYGRQGHVAVVVDIPLLYEVGWEDKCDLVVVVYAPRDVQQERLIARDGMSAEEALGRLNAQMSIEEKRERADLVIDNSGDLRETRRQMTELMEEIRKRAA